MSRYTTSGVACPSITWAMLSVITVVTRTELAPGKAYHDTMSGTCRVAVRNSGLSR